MSIGSEPSEGADSTSTLRLLQSQCPPGETCKTVPSLSQNCHCWQLFLLALPGPVHASVMTRAPTAKTFSLGFCLSAQVVQYVISHKPGDCKTSSLELGRQTLARQVRDPSAIHKPQTTGKPIE